MDPEQNSEKDGENPPQDTLNLNDRKPFSQHAWVEEMGQMAFGTMPLGG